MAETEKNPRNTGTLSLMNCSLYRNTFLPLATRDVPSPAPASAPVRHPSVTTETGWKKTGKMFSPVNSTGLFLKVDLVL